MVTSQKFISTKEGRIKIPKANFVLKKKKTEARRNTVRENLVTHSPFPFPSSRQYRSYLHIDAMLFIFHTACLSPFQLLFYISLGNLFFQIPKCLNLKVLTQGSNSYLRLVKFLHINTHTHTTQRAEHCKSKILILPQTTEFKGQAELQKTEPKAS